MREEIARIRKNGLSLGFVPTMGALHEGHLSLIKKSVSENKITVASVFVNPIQFGKNEDLSKYPRPFESDKRKLEKNGCSLLFFPSPEEMYKERLTTIHVEDLTEKLCGLKRPGHFDGVTTVVAKLFNIVSPDRAYFGEKDFQQYKVLQKMNEDLNFGIVIVPCPIVRENDGLAMSSRNIYLNKRERENAPLVYEELKYGAALLKKGLNPASVIKKIKSGISIIDGCKTDYIEILDESNLRKISKKTRKVRIFSAVFFGKTRLIDNIGVKIK